MAVIAAMVAALGVLAYRAFQIGDEAEKQAQCVDVVKTRVVAFIRLNGRWPGSWEELQTTPRPAGEEAAGGFGELRKRVHIDFSVSLADVARQGPDRFTAVRPTGDAFYQYRTLAEEVTAAASGADRTPNTTAVPRLPAP